MRSEENSTPLLNIYYSKVSKKQQELIHKTKTQLIQANQLSFLIVEKKLSDSDLFDFK